MRPTTDDRNRRSDDTKLRHGYVAVRRAEALPLYSDDTKPAQAHDLGAKKLIIIH